MSDDRRARADARLEAALGGAGCRDPRPHYRRVLRHLKDRDEGAFRRATERFETELVPACLDGDPIAAWLDYGLRLAEDLGDGRIMDIDGTGRARAADDPATATGLLLHIPEDAGKPVVVLREPREATAPQRAALELLVEGRVVASAYG
jgi:hypothetical protein